MIRLGQLRARLEAGALAVVAGALFVLVMSVAFTDGRAAAFLLDRNSTIFPYPFTIQNGMWLVFFIGLGETWVRSRRTALEERQLARGLLPEDPETMLRVSDLGPFLAGTRGKEEFFLQRMVSRCVLQFQSSKSTERANAVLDSSLDLMQHEVDHKYTVLRYLVWVIPTVGFIGTVVGISVALNTAGGADDYQDPALLGDLTRDLGVAFYTTLLALTQSALLVLLQNLTQAREEKALNDAGQYCLDNLINRLYEK